MTMVDNLRGSYRRIRVEAVHKFSIEKIVEGGLHGSSRKYVPWSKEEFVEHTWHKELSQSQMTTKTCWRERSTGVIVAVNQFTNEI